MKNLLFSSFAVIALFFIVSCSYSNQAGNETDSKDSLSVAPPDTSSAPEPVPAADSVPVTKTDPAPATKPEPNQGTAVKGDTVSANSSQVQSSQPGTTSSHPGAVKNPGANQAETDSIKQAKTKSKRK